MSAPYTNKPVLNSDGSVPANFYDYDYWERGDESGRGSYNGNDYSNNLAACQSWARDTWNRWGPFKSYLELGCGRGWAIWGFLNLPDLAVIPLGIDHSHYAVSTAHPDVQPYLIEQDISDLYALGDNTQDLIFSNDVLEHLTPVQVRSCLEHCRRVATTRIVHLISIGDGIDLPDGQVPSDQDQSHVNLKSVTWWVNMFKEVFGDDLETGWKLYMVPHGRTIEVDVRWIGHMFGMEK